MIKPILNRYEICLWEHDGGVTHTLFHKDIMDKKIFKEIVDNAFVKVFFKKVPKENKENDKHFEEELSTDGFEDFKKRFTIEGGKGFELEHYKSICFNLEWHASDFDDEVVEMLITEHGFVAQEKPTAQVSFYAMREIIPLPTDPPIKDEGDWQYIRDKIKLKVKTIEGKEDRCIDCKKMSSQVMYLNQYCLDCYLKKEKRRKNV